MGFLAKVNEVNDEVKNICSPDYDIEKATKRQEELTEQQKKRKEFKEKKKAREEQEMEDKIIRGRSGKGEKDNYKYWCRKCCVEYVNYSPKCFHCGQATVTREDRKKELEEKLELYKKKKGEKK